jgi:ABC-type protease/lipase transport system fused ATPase/permease subunit
LDQVLVMADGRVQAFGPKDEVLSTSLKAVPKPAGIFDRAASRS